MPMSRALRFAPGDDSESYSGTASSEATYGGDDDSNDDYPSCTMGVIALIGDGDCNAINNVLVCGEFRCILKRDAAARAIVVSLVPARSLPGGL